MDSKDEKILNSHIINFQDEKFVEENDEKYREIGLFSFKSKGYLRWALQSLALPPFSIFATAFCIGRRFKEN